MDKSKEKIMESTYKTLSEVGYADLTIDRIAENFSKSKSLIYYHFDSKDELMENFLDYVEEELEERLGDLENEDPGKEFEDVIDLLFCESEDNIYDFHLALFELRNRARYKNGLRERFKRIETRLKEKLSNLAERMDYGSPDQKAEILISTLYGIIMRSVELDKRERMKELKESIKSIVLEGK